MRVPQRLLDTEYPDEYHSLPLDDVKEHTLSGTCWCLPRRSLRRYGEHGFMFLWYHNAADNRQYYDAEDKPLQ